MNVLSILPQPLVEEVLLSLDVRDVVNCGCTSSRFRDIALSETLWRRLVCKKWGEYTEPSRWVVDSAYGYFELVKCKFAYPGSFRALYPVMREYAHLVGGIWLDPDRNRICVFNWKPTCIQGTELTFDDMTAPPRAKLFQRLAPDGVASVHYVNDENCWIKQYKVKEGRLLRSPSSAAEAAATVAVGRYSADTGSELGSSPKGSFEYEMLRFMQANVSSRRRKSRSKSPVQCIHHAELVGQYHLRRVTVQTPTRAHPFKGLWKGDFRGRSGVQVVTVVYDFSQRYAVIKAFKVGSGFGSHGHQPQWIASAQASSFSLSAKDGALISNRLHYLNLRDAIGANPPRLASASHTPETDNAAYQKEVIGSFRGRGRLGNTEEWCEGRLWQYADGDIGFLWILPETNLEGILVDFKRVDHEIPT